jgi:hypothetical protein
MPLPSMPQPLPSMPQPLPPRPLPSMPLPPPPLPHNKMEGPTPTPAAAPAPVPVSASAPASAPEAGGPSPVQEPPPQWHNRTRHILEQDAKEAVKDFFTGGMRKASTLWEHVRVWLVLRKKTPSCFAPLRFAG